MFGNGDNPFVGAWERAASDAGGMQPRAPGTVTHHEFPGADSDDLVYVFPVKVCHACDSKSDELNPFFKLLLLIFARTPQLTLYKFKAWAREQARCPQGNICLLCSMYAYHGHKSEGGKKVLAVVQSTAAKKMVWKTEIAEFTRRVLSGSLNNWQVGAVLVASVVSKQYEGMEEEHLWDFMSKDYMDKNDTEYIEVDLRPYKSVMGRWTRAQAFVAPPGAVRIRMVSSVGAEHNQVLDHSSRAVRGDQLVDSFKAMTSSLSSDEVPGNQFNVPPEGDPVRVEGVGPFLDQNTVVPAPVSEAGEGSESSWYLGKGNDVPKA